MTALQVVHSNHRHAKRDYINRSAMMEPKTGVLFSDFISHTVARRKNLRGNTFAKNYQTLINHLNLFSEKFEARIYTNSVNEEFLEDFIKHLGDLGLKRGYIKTLVSLTKSMARRAGNYGYAIDPSYDNVEVDNDDSFSVYLSMNEITRIYYFQGLTKKQERIRDFFVLGCLTAFRFSDYSTLTENNFQGEFIVKVTKKTGKKVTVPIHDYVKEIFEKYEGKIELGVTVQHFNRYIKMICQKVGINDKVHYTERRYNEVLYKAEPKWKLISSHTARRSFATNMLRSGHSFDDIMTFTGHATQRSLMRYLRITDEEKAKKISGDFFFRK
jgi:integrase